VGVTAGSKYPKGYLATVVAPRSFPRIDVEPHIEAVDGPADIKRDRYGPSQIYTDTVHDFFCTEGASDACTRPETRRRAGCPPFAHAAAPDPLGFRRERAHSTAIGNTDTRMIATMTSSKFSLTKGMLPKKYPANVKSATHAIPPKTL